MSVKRRRAAAGGEAVDAPVAARRASRDPEGTRRAILEAAVREFAREGYGGARIDRISRSARSNDRMVYYYFGSKELLFCETIKKVYADLVTAERAADLSDEDPVRAIERLVEFNWGYYRAHPELISILNTENLYRAEHIRRSHGVEEFASMQLSIIGGIIARGRDLGRFRQDADAVSTFLTVASLTYFYLSNAHTLSHYLKRNLQEETSLEAWLRHVKKVVVASLEVE